jgi:hypothetical protein
MSETPETDAFFFRTDIDWDMEVDFARCLERERDELKKQLIDAKSSTAFWMGKYNNAMQLRCEDPLCDSFWKTLDKLSAERALADRLAEVLDYYYSEDSRRHIASNRRRRAAWNALAAWKEARND